MSNCQYCEGVHDNREVCPEYRKFLSEPKDTQPTCLCFCHGKQPCLPKGSTCEHCKGIEFDTVKPTDQKPIWEEEFNTRFFVDNGELKVETFVQLKEFISKVATSKSRGSHEYPI